jgi:hypothetical protein
MNLYVAACNTGYYLYKTEKDAKSACRDSKHASGSMYAWFFGILNEPALEIFSQNHTRIYMRTEDKACREFSFEYFKENIYKFFAGLTPDQIYTEKWNKSNQGADNRPVISQTAE